MIKERKWCKMFRRYKTKNAKKGARALRRYYRSQKRKDLVKERPDMLLWMVGGSMITGHIVTNITHSVIIGMTVFILCMILEYQWVKGKF